MKKMQTHNVIVPLTVPPNKNTTYRKNYLKVTNNTGRLFLFAADQKIEHLNAYFYGTGITE